MEQSYITIDEFKNANPETNFAQYSDATISGMIRTASSHMDDYVFHSLGLQTITDETSEAMVNSDGDLIIHPKEKPIQSISSIVIKLGNYSNNITLVDGSGNAIYEIPEPKNYILFPISQIMMMGSLFVTNFYQMRSRQFMTKISYVAGYATIPNNIKDACNLWTKDIFIRQSNPMGLGSVSQGGITMNYKEGESEYLKQAKDILKSERKFYY